MDEKDPIERRKEITAHNIKATLQQFFSFKRTCLCFVVDVIEGQDTL